MLPTDVGRGRMSDNTGLVDCAACGGREPSARRRFVAVRLTMSHGVTQPVADPLGTCGPGGAARRRSDRHLE